MNLRSKLRDVPKQLHAGSVGILFVFHSGFGENARYIQAALLGDQTFFESPVSARAPYPNGLFALDEWRDVSACLFVSVSVGGALVCRCLWENPNAHVRLPADLRDSFLAP